MSLKIQVGTVYKTKLGYKVRIYAVDGSGSDAIHGAILHDKKGWVLSTWSVDGYMFVGYPEDDIVSVWEEPKTRKLAYINNSLNIVQMFDSYVIPAATYTRAPWLDEPENNSDEGWDK